MVGNLIFPFPVRRSSDPVPQEREPARPFMHVRSTKAADWSIPELLPQTDSEEAWTAFATDGGLVKACSAWIKRDSLHAWDQTPPTELIAACVQEEQGKGKSGKNLVIAALGKGMEEETLDEYIDKKRGPRPKQFTTTYESCSGYDPTLKGFEKACNYEDYWKGGGREGEAETAAYHDWSHNADTWYRSWSMSMAAVKSAILNPTAASDELKRVSPIITAAFAPYEALFGKTSPESLAKHDCFHAIVDLPSNASKSELKRTTDKLINDVFASHFVSGSARSWYDNLFRPFLSNPAKTRLELPPTHAKGRAQMHEMAKMLGLETKSEGGEGSGRWKGGKGKDSKGSGDKRFVVAYKKGFLSKST